MYKSLAALVPKDKNLPNRAWQLSVYREFLEDTIYDRLGNEFHEEYSAGSGEYIPIANRSPSVRFAMLATIVRDSVSFLFAEGRFPKFDAGDDEKAEESLELVAKDSGLQTVMIEAALRGSVGSVAIWMRVLSDRVFFSSLWTTYLTPHFKADAPDTLEKVVEEYSVKGQALADLGYIIADDDMLADFWWRRVWDENREIWFVPIKVDGNQRPTVEDNAPGRSTTHNLGFVPMVWIKNLPGGNGVDGECTFRLAIPNSIEIDYQLSQAGRGLKYSSSPTLVVRSDNAMQFAQKQKKVAGDALVLPTEGDAKLLEIGGDAAKAVIEYARELRKLALESVGGSRSDSDKLSAATSGRAMELMNQALINLADTLRGSYGQNGLMKLLKMVAAVSRSFKLKTIDGDPIGEISEKVRISLVWPRWYAPTADDRQADAGALSVLKAAGLITTETGVRSIAADYDIDDVAEELAAIKTETADAQAAQVALKTAAKIPPPQK